MDLPILHLHQALWHPRRAGRHDHLQVAAAVDGGVVCALWRHALCLYRRPRRKQLHWHQRARLLLPEHVQRHPLRHDARVLPGSREGHGVRRRVVFRSRLWHHCAAGGREGVGRQSEWGSVPGWEQCFRQYDICLPDSWEVYWWPELLMVV